jgi:cytochrome c oxidase subunit 2
LDTDHDADSKDDIVTAEMAIPVNREFICSCTRRMWGIRSLCPNCGSSRISFPAWIYRVHFTATKIGRYEIVCTQLCGLGHYNMKAYLSVLSPGRL